MKAVFADINKLRNDNHVVSNTDGNPKPKRRIPPPPPPPRKSVKSSMSNSNNYSPLTGPKNSSYMYSGDISFNSDMHSNISSNLSSNISTLQQPKKKKKKKKKNKNNMPGNYVKLNDNNGNNYTSMEYGRSSTNAQILEKGLPDYSDFLDLTDKPPMLLFTYVLAFISSIDMMVFLPTLYDATKDNNDSGNYYVYVFMSYIISQFISQFLIGFWEDRRPILEILYFLVICLIIGNVIYASGISKKNSEIMLIGRLICGICGSILIIGYAHVVKYGKFEGRENRILFFKFIVSLGTIFGPLIGVIVSNFNFSIGIISISSNNSGSFIVICLSIIYITILTIYAIVRCNQIKKKKERETASEVGISALWGRKVSESLDSNLYDSKYVFIPHRFCSINAFIIWLLYGISVFSFWSFEGAIIPIGQVVGFNLQTRQLYAIFLFIGICYILSFGINKYILIFIIKSREKKVIISFLLMITGCLIISSLGINDDAKNTQTWQIVIATPFLTSGFCIATQILPSLFVSLIGAKIVGLGIRTSWFFALAQFGVLFGPLYGYIIIKTYKSVNFVAHTSAFMLIIGCFIAVLAFKTTSKIYDYDRPKRVTSSQDFNDEMDPLKKGLLTDRL